MIDWSLDDTGIATLRLSRAAARNAIPIESWAALAHALSEIANSDARVLIFRSGVDGIFSSGADIADFAPLEHDAAARMRFRKTMRGAIDALAGLPLPSIAAIDGGCFGAAVALVLACDIRIAGAAARFATTPAKLGIGYPKEDVARLIGQIGRGQASRMLFSAAPIDAGEAVRIRLAEIAAPDAVEEALRLAQTITVLDSSTIAMLKRTLADPADSRHDQDFDAAFGDAAFSRAFAAFRASKAR